MAIPPQSPGPYPPPAAPPPYAGYPPPYAPYPPPPPRKDNTLPILVIVLVVVFVVIPAIIAIWFFMFMAPLIPSFGSRPTVTFSAVSQPQGNATFTIATISQSTIAGLFGVNLRVDGALGDSPETLDESGASISAGGTTYRVYWEDLGNPAYVSAGDGFRVTGDGVSLDAGAYELYLLWVFDGAVVATASWIV